MESDSSELVVDESSSVKEPSEVSCEPTGSQRPQTLVPSPNPVPPDATVEDTQSVDLSGDSARELNPKSKTLAGSSVKEFLLRLS